MKKVVLLIYVIACTSLLLHAQTSVQTPTIIPPSPQAQAFMRYGEIPINYSTGVPNIEIPIYTLEGKKLKVPISISYHASGIKVNDIASEVGLGWALNSGGMISRTVMGKPDERAITNKTFSYAQQLLDSVQAASLVPYDYSCNCLKGMYNLEYWFSQQNGFETEDSESDRFYYTLPNGISGVFRYDYLNNNNVITLPYRMLKIEKILNIPHPAYEDTKIIGFKITDENGTVYKFEPFLNYSPQYYSEWYLREIISADGTDTITFEYTPSTANTSIPVYSYVLTEDLNDEGNINCTPSVNRDSYLSLSTSQSPITNTPTLKSIVSSTAIVNFDYDTQNRSDFSQLPRLKEITISPVNSSSTILRRVAFTPKYFGTTAENKRLGLDNVIITAPGDILAQKYLFTYENMVLPPYPYKMASPRFNEDFWGYYNGSNSLSPIPSDFITDSFDKSYYGSNRVPDPDYSKACMLKEVKYPTGGKTIFQFERNQGFNVFPTKNNYNNYVGGFRIGSITNKNENDEVVGVKIYEYSEAYTRQIKSGFFRYNQRNAARGSDGSTGCWMTYSRSMVFDNPILPLEVASGLPIMYTSVTEYNGTKTNNAGKTVYKYNPPYSPSDFEANPQHPQYEDIWYYHSFHYDKGNYIPELISKTDYSFDGTNYHPVSKTKNVYDTLFTTEFQTGIKLTRPLKYESENYFNFSPIFLGNPIFSVVALQEEFKNSFVAIDTKAYQEASLLTRTEDYTYNPTDSTKYVVSTNDFEYDPGYLPLTKQTTSTSMPGINKVTEFKYPFNFPGIVPYNSMTTKNMISPVIESTTTHGTATEKLKTNYFNPSGNIIVPQTVEKTIGTSTNTLLTYNSYDDKGNITQYTGADGLVITLLWAYNKTYPVAKIVSGSATTINDSKRNAINGHVYCGTDIKSSVDEDILFLKTELSSLISDYQVTFYTYKPLLSITSQTDPNGKTTYYEYDTFGRLKLIRDDQNNILKKIDYHYSTQN